VALLEEGVELREAGIRIPILVMGGYYGRAWSEVIDHSITPIVYEHAHLESLAREVNYRNSAPVAVHLKIDTGMSRLGVRFDQLDRCWICSSSPGIRWRVAAHFANAE
jgi:alanine racemase